MKNRTKNIIYYLNILCNKAKCLQLVCCSVIYTFVFIPLFEIVKLFSHTDIICNNVKVLQNNCYSNNYSYERRYYNSEYIFLIEKNNFTCFAY